MSRKKTMRYRLNGRNGIRPARIDDLQIMIDNFQAKLNDPDDLDDKKWVKRWLDRFSVELAKKEKGLERRDA
jgi:hypothetical protein